MKRLLPLLLLLVASPSWAAFTFVQKATPVTAGATTGSISLTGVTTGHLLVLVLCAVSTTAPSAVTEGSDTVVTDVAYAKAEGNGSSYCGIYDAIAGSTSITWNVTFGTSNQKALFAYEWSGNAASGSEFDKATAWALAGSAGTAATSAALTPTNANELAITVATTVTTVTSYAWGGGYAARDNVANFSNAEIWVGDQVLSGSPSTTSSSSWTGSSSWGIGQAFFVPSAGVSCTHEGITSGGALAIPNGSSGSYWGNGSFVTPNCSSVQYWQPTVGNFGTS